MNCTRVGERSTTLNGTIQRNPGEFGNVAALDGADLLGLPLAILRRSTIQCGEPLLAYLLPALGLKRKVVKELLRRGAVMVNGKSVSQFDHWLSPGDEVIVSDRKTAIATTRLEHARIRPVFEDESLIVVDKPSGLLTVATDRQKSDTLFVRLNEYLRARDSARAARAYVVHRLDQETSGLVLFAKSEAVKRQLQEAWPTVEKMYWAVVEGQPTAQEGTVTNFLFENKQSLKVCSSDREVWGARQAITQYRVLRTGDGTSLLEVYLKTGRKHQIRVHLAGLGCPVLGDRKYGSPSTAINRLALHAGRLSLTHPTTGRPLSLESPLPKAFAKLL